MANYGLPYVIYGSESSSNSDQELIQDILSRNQNMSYSTNPMMIQPILQPIAQPTSQTTNASVDPRSTVEENLQPPTYSLNRSTEACSHTSHQNGLSGRIINSSVPLDVNTTETVTVQGETGILANREDISNWSGPLALSEYPINDDPNPEVIHKKSDRQINYTQEIAIRYLKPPTPPPPGDILVKRERALIPPPAPPIVIRQQPPRPDTPPPVIFREAPPKPPPHVGTKVIHISAPRIPPPPRKVIIERLAPLPPKPQSIIVERWLSYPVQKRRVIFSKENNVEMTNEKVKNVIIQWDAPRVTYNREFKDLGVVRANPEEYTAKYSNTLKTVGEMPDFVRDVKPPSGLSLASDVIRAVKHELEGDVYALSLVDLNREGLEEYSRHVTEQNRNAPPHFSQVDPEVLRQNTNTHSTFRSDN